MKVTRHRRPPPRKVSKRPSPDNFVLPDLDGLLYVLRDNLRRADAMVSTAERQIEEPRSVEVDVQEEDEDGGVQRRRMHTEYLVEAGKEAVRAALYTTEQIEAALARRRDG